MSAYRWLPLVALTLAAGLFAYFNAGQRIAIGIGVTTFYRVPLVPVVFTSFVLGMLTMFLVGLRHDRHMRRLLEERDSAARERRAPDPPIASW
jgi:uncharacterized integral membrane protein